MLIEIAIAALFLLLIFTIAYALNVFGLFHRTEVKVGKPPFDINGQEVAYKLSTGPYNQSGHMFTELIGDIFRIDPSLSKEDLPMIGFYYDDPAETEEEKCRYAVGVVLKGSGSSSTTDEKTTEGPCLKSGLTEQGYLITRLPTVDYVVHSHFPYHGPFSIFFAVRKVYPLIKSYVQEHNLCAHPCLEVYIGDNIYFILPLSKQDHFYLFDDDEEETDDGESSRDSGSESSRSGSETHRRPSDGASSTKAGRLVEATASSSRSNSFDGSSVPVPSPPGATKTSPPIVSSKRGSTSSFEEISVNEVPAEK